MTPYQVSSEIYGGFFYSGSTLSTTRYRYALHSKNLDKGLEGPGEGVEGTKRKRAFLLYNSKKKIL